MEPTLFYVDHIWEIQMPKFWEGEGETLREEEFWRDPFDEDPKVKQVECECNYYFDEHGKELRCREYVDPSYEANK